MFFILATTKKIVAKFWILASKKHVEKRKISKLPGKNLCRKIYEILYGKEQNRARWKWENWNREKSNCDYIKNYPFFLIGIFP